MLEPTKLSDDRRDYVCARCGKAIPHGCAVLGNEKSGKLVGVAAWSEGTLRGGAQGMVRRHGCGDAPDMPADVQGHHDQLRGAAAPAADETEA